MKNELRETLASHCMYEAVNRKSTLFSEITEKMYSSHLKIDSTFSALGKSVGDDYNVSDQALDALNEIYCKLTCEDQTLRTFRRALGLGHYVQNDLIPFLVNVKDPKLIDIMIRIMVNLTMPVECLFSTKVMMRTEIGRHTVSDLTMLLSSCKESFTDARAIRAVVEYMKNVIDNGNKLPFEHCDRINNCLVLLRNILHIPENANQNERKTHTVSMQNKIIWHLFMMSIDKLLLFLMSCSQRDFWSVTMVQLISVMYKDQQASTLQKLLNVWLEDALSDSSDDFESNTTPPQKENSGESSPVLTSDPTSDSSDNGGGNGKNVDKSSEMTRRSQANVKSVEAALNLQSQQTMEQSENIDESTTQTLTEEQDDNDAKPIEEQSEQSPWINHTGPSESPLTVSNNKKLATIVENVEKRPKYPSIQDQSASDCGYGTHPESSSITSSEDQPSKNVHQKPQRFHVVKKPCKVLSVQEQKKKKLVKRSKSSLINMKGLVHHTPTDEDISNILKEFTVDFLLKGYGHLMQELYAKLLSDSDMQAHIDTSHFFWLVTYFLKFAAQLELDLEHIKCVLSYKIVSYLTYEAVILYEQLELTSRHYEIDLEASLRRMHLVVTAIREFLQALNTYTNIGHLSANDVKQLRMLQLQISLTEDLKQLFILLIRNYKPSIQSKQYLQDLIVTNHILLLIPDSFGDAEDRKTKSKLKEHIQQFATVEMMQQYGILLEGFLENGEFVNDCILTMMYHVGGEIGAVTALFLPIILKTFSKIWETEYELCDDWSDLIFYVMTKFISTPQKPPLNLSAAAAPSLIVENHLEQLNEKSLCNWSKEECDVLYWYYEESKSFPDLIGQMVKRFQDSNFKPKYRIDVIQQLLQQDIINRMEFNALMKYENDEFERNFQVKPNVRSSNEPNTSIGNSVRSHQQAEKSRDDIQILKERLQRENKGNHIIWLQRILIEYCFAKLCFLKNQFVVKNCDEVTIIEPVPHHCILKKQSVPVVPYSIEQTNILSYEPFILLLHGLGLHLPVDAGKLFVRIPEFWTADILYSVAEKLGPIDNTALKFDVNELRVKSAQFTMHASINHEEKIDKNGDVFTTNGDLNFALPTNILNTSSILNRQIHTSRSNASRNVTSTNGFSGFTDHLTKSSSTTSTLQQHNPDISVSISIASNAISIVQSSKVSVSSDCANVNKDSVKMDIDTDSSVTFRAGTSLELNDGKKDDPNKISSQASKSLRSKCYETNGEHAN
ncbi:protein timeless isoform X2 [Contarinia nasturtii]|uniref:protein timeless isoform X2 n=1 Tax=Contarinia nasturtii TaxID=265458 RepID=UPI0012D4B4E5|nr:protein timeless isoform X2 [Contarinia nasturtii]